MPERIPQSVAIRVPLKAYLSADHVSPATGKTIDVVVSLNGAAFDDPNAGATTATEVGSGWYYVDLDTTDTGTLGPLIVRGTEADTDPVEVPYHVVAASADPTTVLEYILAIVGGTTDPVGSTVTFNDQAGDPLYEITYGAAAGERTAAGPV